MKLLFQSAFLAQATCHSLLLAAQVPEGSAMSYLSNAVTKVGVDLNRGGAIVFLSRTDSGNLINNFDLGRQVQLSFFSGPVPFTAEGKTPAKHWQHLGWNPIQAGDDFKHPSQVLEHRNDGQSIYVRTLPLQWPLNLVPGECTFESWLRLEGPVVKVRAKLNNARPDKTQYAARLQELPAAYANAPFHRVISYMGDRPFSGAPVSVIPKATGRHPWSFWQATEGWSALVDENDFGLGVITPERIFFTGGFAGVPGPNDTHSSSTGYLASQGSEVLDHNIHYEFRYELLAGSLDEIRARAAAARPSGLPAWTFASERQGWHYVNACDQGWPINGALDVRLDQNDPQLIGPYCFWRAEEAPSLEIECAFKATGKTATVYWQRHGEAAPGPKDFIAFPIQTDGEFHRYEISLASVPHYQGGMIRLRFDPVAAGNAGNRMLIKSIRLKNQKSTPSPK